MIKLTNVTKIYKTGVRALNDVNLTIEPGEFVYVIGTTGAGKSTFIKLLYREEKATSGKVEVVGQDVSKIRNSKVPYFRRNIGVVFQNFRLLPKKTVFENVAYALEVIDTPRAEIRRRVRATLELVGLEDKVNAFPHELSGGQQQRVAIARAIVNRPKVLIADEPTTALDVVVQAQILEMLKRLQKEENMSIILVTHDFGVVARMADRVAVMYSGSIVEQGSLKDIYYRTKHPYTRALLKSQPRLNDRKGKELYTLEGTPPILKNIPEGCPFCFRCENAMNICVKKMPKATDFNEEHKASCWLFHNENVRSEGEING
jgi:cell division ATP-binding protein FtsE